MIYVGRRCILNVISSFERVGEREMRQQKGRGDWGRVNSENKCNTFDVTI